VDALTARVRDAYRGLLAVLQEFGALQVKFPDDIEPHISKCRFLQSFASAEDASIERVDEGPLAGNAGVQLHLL
jgi:hypothetical protein